jgi:hypothetical protein
MSKKPKGDDVAAVLAAIGRSKAPHGPRKGNMTTEPRKVPLDRVVLQGSLAKRAQFREGLNQDTLERMKRTLEGDDDRELDDAILVEAALYHDADGEQQARAVAAAQEGDEMGYLVGDGVRRCTTYRDLGRETINADVVLGAQNPLHVAKKINIIININPQTHVKETERQAALYTMHELEPEMTERELAVMFGYSHTHVGRLLDRGLARTILQEAGAGVPGNNELLEELGKLAKEVEEANTDEQAATVLPELARFCARERVKPDDLAKARARAGRVSDADWSAERDWRGQDARIGHEWAQSGTASRLALAHQATKHGWTDQELVWSARYLESIRGREERDEYRDLLRGDLEPASWMSESAYYKDYEPAAPQPQPAPPAPEPQGGPPVPPVAGPVVPEPVLPEPEPARQPQGQGGTPVPPEPRDVRGRTPAQQGAEEAITRCLDYALQIERALHSLADAGAERLDADDVECVQSWIEVLEEGALALGMVAGNVAGAAEVGA